LNYKPTESPRIYAPDDGRSMGLQGMINDLVEQSDFPTGNKLTDEVAHWRLKSYRNCKNYIGSRDFSGMAKPALASLK
jgi:methylmalonyl-CoA mutase